VRLWSSLWSLRSSGQHSSELSEVDLAGPAAGKLTAAFSIAVLAGVNLYGAKPGARVSTTLTAAKLLPLLALALAGAPLLMRSSFSALRPFAPHGWAALPRACFLAYFAFQGFEVVPVPAGEAREPGRDAPFAVLSALALAAGLYALVQASALAAVPGLAGSERPLADAGLALFGAAGGKLVAAGALISMAGFTAGCALGGPRYLVALAEEGHLWVVAHNADVPEWLHAVARASAGLAD